MSKDTKKAQDEYNELKSQLTKEILKKQELNNRLNKLEDLIYERENDYFDESLYGNIVKGFENFSKNTNISNKRKISYTDDDHIFSLSSSNYIRNLMKRQGETHYDGQPLKDDFDDFEDSIEPPNGTPGGMGSHGNGPGSVHPGTREDSPSHSTPGRKRKVRNLDD